MGGTPFQEKTYDAAILGSQSRRIAMGGAPLAASVRPSLPTCRRCAGAGSPLMNMFVFPEGFVYVNLNIPLCCKSRECLRLASKSFVRAVTPSESACLIAAWLSAYMVVGLHSLSAAFSLGTGP